MATARSAAAALLSAAAAFHVDYAAADGPFRLNPFSSPTSAPQQQPPPPPPTTQEEPPKAPEMEKKPRNDNPRTTAAGFDPEALERGAKALKEINSSSQAKKVFELMEKQEKTRQAELTAKKAEFQAIQSQHETDRQRVVYEEQKKLVQQQAQTKAQMARYEDELARKRMQAENENQRARNQELVRMQEESSVRLEQARRATEEEIQAQRRRTEKERAEIERETIRVKALAEAEGRAHEAKLAEEVNKRMLVERANAEREKWVAAINTAFDHIGGGLRAILTDQNKLVVAVGGVTALAAGVYTTRRNKTYMSESQRSALNALLFRTGDQSKDIVLALATNRPGDLDSAVADRIDEVLEFPLPGEDERYNLLKLYIDKYIAKAGNHKSGSLNLLGRQQQKIEIRNLSDDLIREAASKTEGFSGREIAKLMASVQAAVYGSKDCILDPLLFREVVDYKAAEHQQRRKLATSEAISHSAES